MRKLALILTTLAFVMVAPITSAHPPATDPHNGCLVQLQRPAPGPAPGQVVIGTVSYIAPLNPPLPPQLPCRGFGSELTHDPFGNPITGEWGSHASPCTPGIAGAVYGAYCGPVVPPGGFAFCSWTPILNTVPTQLVVGWDNNGDGFQNLVPTGAEPFVYGPYPQFPPAWMIPNPYNVPAQVIAFPTMAPAKVPAPAGMFDLNRVICF